MAEAGEFTGGGRSGWLRRGLGAALVGAVALVAGCDEREVILPGKREDPRSMLRTEDTVAVEPTNRTAPISLPKAVVNANWHQGRGTPATRTVHPALSSAPQLIWSTDIGSGDGRRHRITADPVVAGSRVFTLDSVATVTATSTSGQTLWSRDLVPPRESHRDASGGGLAYGDGKLFVTSGFGFVAALDPASGAVLWQQDLDAPGNGNPVYSNGVVYLVAGDATATAIGADDGRVRWRLASATRLNGVMGGSTPAVGDKFTIFPYSSGELVAALRNNGLRRWDTFIAGRRDGFARANAPEVTGDPVILGDTIYVGTSSGRFGAFKLGNGERIWTAHEGALSPPAVIGGAIFIITDRNELVRLDAGSGDRVWGVELPFFVKSRAKQQKEIYAHHGPVVAGGQVVVASNDGKVRFFDPRSGALARSMDVPGGATTNPVVAGGVLYLVSTTGKLMALR